METGGYRVHVHRKSGASEHALSEGGEISFGRDPDCTVVLHEGRVSRRHAVLRLRGGVLQLTDLGSRNGTAIDGEKAAPNTAVTLRETSVIRIGEGVVTLEPARAAGNSPWCFDRRSFETRAGAALGEARKGVAALIEIAWEDEATGTTTSDTAGPPVGLQQVLTKIVGPRGVIGAHEGRRVLLLVPDTDAERLDATVGS